MCRALAANFCWCSCEFFVPAEQFSVEVSLTAYQIMIHDVEEEFDCDIGIRCLGSVLV